MKVLITRTDRLGDLVLSLPVLALLKQAQPDWEIHVMVAPLAVPLVENDPHVARVWTWHDKLAGAELKALATALRAEHFDAAVLLQYRRELAGLLRQAGIGRRYGPWSRWSSWLLLNCGQRQNRSAGGRHELEFNLDLARRLLADHGLAGAEPETPTPRLTMSQTGHEAMAAFRAEFEVGEAEVVFVHPGSGGSALDWEPERFAAVANQLAMTGARRVFVTGAEPDAKMVAKVARDLGPAVTVLQARYSLREFLGVLSAGHLLVGPSTGPLHLAAALGLATVGLFPPVRTMHPDRWGARGWGVGGHRDLVPALSCPARRSCQAQRCEFYNCMREIRVEAVVAAAHELLTRTGAGGLESGE